MSAFTCARAVARAVAFAAAVTLSSSASAQEPHRIDSASDTPPFLVTPFIAVGDDLAPVIGTAFAYAWTSRLRLEVEASIGTDAARSSVSLLHNVPFLGRLVYVAGGIGVQRDEVPTDERLLRFGGAASLEALTSPLKKTELAWNVGAGVVVPVGDRWSYRADFRWYNPDNEWPESWRASSGIVFGLRL